MAWFDGNARILPWRDNPTPYRVWISEIMLQQTTVAAVIPYFEKWMAKFPTLEDVAKATEEEVMQVWQGLGYYSRALNILKAAQIIQEKGWPLSTFGLKLLPGIGPYTAGAIASLALQISTPCVDGNIERVYSRLTADAHPKPQLNTRAWDWAKLNLSKTRAGDWNQALMELGATICRPKNPLCETCPLAGSCQANKEGTQDQYPVKTPAKSLKPVHFTAQIHICKGDGEPRVMMRVAKPGEWCQGTYVFPYKRTHPPSSGESEIAQVNHVVTNHKLTFSIHLAPNPPSEPDFVIVPVSQLEEIPISSAHRKIWRAVAKKLFDLK